MRTHGFPHRFVWNNAVTSNATKLRWLYLALAYIFTGLAILGAVLPVMPTTPFLIAAAWAASRGSKKFHHALVSNRYFGPMIDNWETQRAISTRAKWLAVMLLIPSWISVTWFSQNIYLSALTGVLFIAVAVFIVTRATPQQ